MSGVIAWGGDDTHGQSSPPPETAAGIVAVGAGEKHSLALTDAGEVMAWGDDTHGQSTVPVGAQSGVTAIACGWNHSLALKDDGSVIAWGDNGLGQTSVPAEASDANKYQDFGVVMDISGFSVKYMTRDYVEMLYKRAWENYNADLIDPESVNQVSMYTSPSLQGAIALSVDLARNICFVVSYYSHSLTAVDVSNPAAMSEIQSYSSLSLNAPYAVHCDYDNNIALVASYENNQLTAIDISNPSAMTEVSSYSSSALEGALIMVVDSVDGYIYAVPYFKEPITTLETVDSSDFIEEIKPNTTGALDKPWGVSADTSAEIAFFPDYDESGIRAFSFLMT
jgi:hypothetical protein